MRRITAFVLVGLVFLGVPAGAQPEEGDGQRGEQVYQAHCAMCHGSDAAGMMGMHPSLRGAVERLSREGVEVTIRKGRNTMPPMPAFEGDLSDQAIADVLAYLASLPSGPRNFGPERGAGDGRGGMMDGTGTKDESSQVAAWLLAALAVLVVALVTLAVVVARRRPAPVVGTSDARSILDRRYASGELTRDEYLQRRQDLEA